MDEFTYKHFWDINRRYFEKFQCVFKNKYIHNSQGINQIPVKRILGGRLYEIKK